MKTLTEFSAVVLQRAAQVRGEVLDALKKAQADQPVATKAAADEPPAESPADVAPAAPVADAAPDDSTADAATEDVTTGAAADASADAAADASADAAAPAEPVVDDAVAAAVPADVDADGADAPQPLDEGDSAKASDEQRKVALNDAVRAALEEKLGLSSDRASRLLEALRAVGKNVKSVRLVRVFEGESAPASAKTIDGFHYVIDRIAQPRKGRDDRGRGGKGGRDHKGGRERKGGGPGGGGPGGGGPGRGRSGGPGGGGRGRRDDREGGGERIGRGEIPAGGLGWTLSRAPRDPNDRGPKRPKRGGPKRGPKRKDGPGGGRPRRDSRSGPPPKVETVRPNRSEIKRETPSGPAAAPSPETPPKTSSE